MSTIKQTVLNYDGLKRFYQGLLNKFVPQEEGKGLSTNDYTATDKSKVALIDNKVDKVQGKQLSTNDFTNEEKSKLASLAQSNWAASENEPGHVLNRTHYDTVMTKTLYNGTITATAGKLTRINSIPDEMIVNYPDVSVVRATFDGKACTIIATTNKWELRDPNGQLVFTMNYDTAKGAQCLVSTYAGSGAHTLVIEADEITAVPLDEKYIPDTIPRRTDIPKMAMPDWNASEGEAGYVKNRTHYEEKNVIIPNTIVDVPSSDLFAALPVLDTAIVAGNSYVVELDNERYTCVAWADGDVIYLGNGNVYPGVNKGENVPFSIDTYPDKTAFLNTQVGKEYVVSIATPGNVKKLDEKFLPDNLVRLNNLHAVATSGNYNDLTNKPTIPSLNGYATETYVNNKVAGIKHPVDSVNGKTGTVVLTAADVKALPDTTVIPSIDGLASTTYVDNKVAALVDSSPDTLNTLNELAAALGDDPNFATTVATQIGELEESKVEKIAGKGLSTNDYTTADKTLLNTIAEQYLTRDDVADLNTKIEAAHSHATTYKGSAFANGLYKITTNAEGHVTGATAVAKADITALGIPAQDTDTGATSVEVTGAGNAITAASYDATSRKLTLTKGATYTNNQGTITGVNAGTSLSGGGTSGAVSISHAEGSAINKTVGLYKFATDATSHVKSVTAVNKADIVALGIPAQDTTYSAITNSEIDAICGQL